MKRLSYRALQPMRTTRRASRRIARTALEAACAVALLVATMMVSAGPTHAAAQRQRAATIPASVSYGNLPWPHWWSATCNGLGHLLTTGQGKLGGLQVCTRPDGTLEGDRVTAKVAVDGGILYEWQCTELSERYMDIAWGVAPYLSRDADHIADDFPFGTYPNIEKIYNNGVAGLVPQPGDVMQLSAIKYGPDPGHTGVIESTSVNSSGSGYVVMLSENGSLAGRYNLNVGAAAGKPAWVVGGDGVNYTTAWLHNPNGVQTDDYVYSVGQNGDLFSYHWADGGTWTITDLGGPGGGHQFIGSPSGQTEIQDGAVVQDVYVNDNAGSLHEFWYQNGAWHNGVLPASGTKLVNSPSAFSYTLPAQTSENHSIFDVGTDVYGNAYLFNYSWHESGGGWTVTNLTTMTGGYVSPYWSPSAEGFLQSGTEEQAAYVDAAGGQLDEFWWNGTWHFDSPSNVWSLPSGVTVASDISSMTFSYPDSPATNRHGVFFTGSNDHLYEYQWAQGSVWTLIDLSTSVGSTTVYVAYAPSANAFVQSGVGVQDIFVRGTEGDLHEFYFTEGVNVWKTDDVSVATSSTGDVIIGGPSSFSNFVYAAPMNVRHSVFVVTTDGTAQGHLREFLWAQGTTPWELLDHGAPSNAPLLGPPNAHSF